MSTVIKKYLLEQSGTFNVEMRADANPISYNTIAGDLYIWVTESDSGDTANFSFTVRDDEDVAESGFFFGTTVVDGVAKHLYR